jgi:hypothetical protein
MGDKTSYGLLFSILLVAVVIIAGCSSSSPPAATPTQTTVALLNKFVAGDILAKSSSSTDQPLYLILGYDKSKDTYSRAFIYKNSDGSWGHRINTKNDTFSRLDMEKVYPAKIAHVALTSVPIVTATIPTATPLTYSAAAPIVNKISPTSGGIGQTVTMTMTGSNFQSGATAKLLRGGNPVIIASAVSATSTSVTGTFNLNSAEEGHYNVIVTNPDGQSDTLIGAFTVGEAAPIVTGVYPNTGAVNETVFLTINGQNFGDLAKVSFSKGSSTIDDRYLMNSVTIGSTKVTLNLKIPAGTPVGDWDVTVLNVEGQGSGTWNQKFHITNSTA